MNLIIDSVDATLRERAQKVVPSGMWGHQHASAPGAGAGHAGARPELTDQTDA